MFLWGGQQRKRKRERQGNSDAIDAMPDTLPESLWQVGMLVVVICISFSWFADFALWTLPDAA